MRLMLQVLRCACCCSAVSFLQLSNLHEIVVTCRVPPVEGHLQSSNVSQSTPQVTGHPVAAWHFEMTKQTRLAASLQAPRQPCSSGIPVSLWQGAVRIEDCNGRQPVAEPLGIITIEDVIEELLQQVRAPPVKGIEQGSAQHKGRNRLWSAAHPMCSTHQSLIAAAILSTRMLCRFTSYIRDGLSRVISKAF